MRLLFAFAGGNGHFQPLVPLARAAVAAGHTVAVTGQPALMPHVEKAGLTALPSGRLSTMSGERSALLRADPAREDRDFRDGFAGRIATDRAPAVRELAREWRPDVIVCDETDFGSMIAAETLGIPHASVLVLAAGTFGRPDGLAARLDEVRAEHGLAPDPGLAMLDRHLVISPVPPSFRAVPLPPTGRLMQLAVPVPSGRSDTVYFTLGTIFNTESGDLFGRVVAGLREVAHVNLVVTVGDSIDPAELGPQPPHVRVERYVPQAELLPSCAAVVSHAGSGSVLGALAHGLPMVLLPMGADQPANAVRCAELGVGVALDALDTTPEQARDALATVLTDPSYRAAATRLQQEIAVMPSPAALVPLLEGL
ncbi:glycosyltransferase [Dactylosporangium sp. AC04546]|uniref:glycosyltransferase n=1 Tax=Dactylosporangium sp. AC04546 TaxID=2862460 RepID=UPI001EDE596C|nr:glycosyltransferase [Dactylosporangium sp. AC04546]WVK85009.1 glycosyltransferase [Dactylosporangium sp. AC04546]